MKFASALLVGCVLLAALTHEAFAQDDCKSVLTAARSCLKGAVNSAQSGDVAAALDNCKSQAEASMNGQSGCDKIGKALNKVFSQAKSAAGKVGKALKAGGDAAKKAIADLGKTFGDIAKSGLDSLKG